MQFVAPHNYNKDSREAVYPWLAHWLENAPKAEYMAEPSMEVEPHKNLEVFGPDPPRPKDAVDANGLDALLKEKIRKQLEALWPRDAVSLERFRRIMTPALRCTLSVKWPGSDEIEAVTVKKARHDGSFSTVSICNRTLPATIELTASIPTSKKRFASLLVTTTTTETESVLHSSQVNKQAIFLLRLQPHKPGKASGGNEEQRRQFVSAYCRTALAWQVQDVLTAIAYLTEQRGFGEVRLAGLGEAGIPILLARALEPTGKVGLTIADLAHLDGGDEQTWSGPRTQAGMWRNGGLRTAAILAAPGELVVHDASAHFDAAAIRTVYRILDRASALEISESLWSIEMILKKLETDI